MHNDSTMLQPLQAHFSFIGLITAKLNLDKYIQDNLSGLNENDRLLCRPETLFYFDANRKKVFPKEPIEKSSFDEILSLLQNSKITTVKHTLSK